MIKAKVLFWRAAFIQPIRAI